MIQPTVRHGFYLTDTELRNSRYPQAIKLSSPGDEHCKLQGISANWLKTAKLQMRDGLLSSQIRVPLCILWQMKLGVIRSFRTGKKTFNMFRYLQDLIMTGCKQTSPCLQPSRIRRDSPSVDGVSQSGMGRNDIMHYEYFQDGF